MLGEKDRSLSTTGGTQVEALAGERAKVIMTAFGVGTADPRDTLEINIRAKQTSCFIQGAVLESSKEDADTTPAHIRRHHPTRLCGLNVRFFANTQQQTGTPEHRQEFSLEDPGGFHPGYERAEIALIPITECLIQLGGIHGL